MASEQFGADDSDNDGEDSEEAPKPDRLEILIIARNCERSLFRGRSSRSEYLRAGVVGFGVGGPLIRTDLLERGDLGSVISNAERYLSATRRPATN